MTDSRLKQSERADVFRLLVRAGFRPAEFQWEEKRDYESFRSSMGGGEDVVVSVLRHIRTAYFLRFGAFGNEFSPAPGRRVEYQSHDGDWPDRVRSCTTWLTELRKEVDTPDPWTVPGQQFVLALTSPSSSLDNDAFSVTEKQHIAESLVQIKENLVAMEHFNTRQAAIIDFQFKHLNATANRFGRKDWLTLLFNTLVCVMVALTLSKEQGDTLFRLTGDCSISSGMEC